MNVLRFLIAFFIIPNLCFGQSAKELNEQSKVLLAKNDITSALPLLKQAADAGSAETQYNYGLCFQQGIGVTHNDTTANHWYLKAATQGNVDAQFKISYSYVTGRGCAKDDKRAFYWSVKCAQQNDPTCMFNTISCYKDGLGTTRNTDSMMVWAIRLASLPDVEDLQQSGNITSARLNLATMYLNGSEVKKDLHKSYLWLLIYNESKRDFSFVDQQKAIDMIKSVEKDLTEKDKKNATTAAEKQIGHPLKNLSHLYTTDLD
ncbi:hypothetical protein CJD36_017035 [Flavipsychrobacter stenotrophus]|uniref:Sel1 repeat family protein n=1 Tax=Flavipsychrobacter stenotrophus TaxID=2077091 RepID=A0A2S7SSN3_9BACT|nr:tetratricopeptide repeat protein [Flavipsychrobacter stenotrophus]PQJ09641.1 hypothetical protein CJD36_017035 [Flavipsychrobacter stenotrophus]